MPKPPNKDASFIPIAEARGLLTRGVINALVIWGYGTGSGVTNWIRDASQLQKMLVLEEKQ